MNSNTRCIRLFTALTLVLSALAVTLRSIACMTDLEYIYGYFGSHTVRIAGTTAFAVGCIVLLSYFLFSVKMSVKPSFTSPSTYMPTGIVATGLIFTSVALLIKVGTPEAGQNTYLIIATAVLALLSVVHFFLNAFLTESSTELRAYFSLATVMFLALYAAFLYFDRSLPLNSSNKLTDQLAFLFSAIFFLYEARISLGREKWRGYVAFGCVSAFATAYSSIPSLIVYVVKGYTISNSIEESVLCFTLFIFIISRLILTASLPEIKENRFISAMQSYAERRENIITESMKVHREAYSQQMTIDDLLDLPTDHLALYEKYEEEEETAEEKETEPDDGQIEMLDLFDALSDEDLADGNQEDIFAILDEASEEDSTKEETED